MTKTLNEMLFEEATETRRRLETAGIKMESFNINVNWHYGSDTTISYNIGSYSDTDKVEGRDLYDVVTEYMRRKGWTEANKPMTMLAAPVEFNDATTDDKYTL